MTHAYREALLTLGSDLPVCLQQHPIDAAGRFRSNCSVGVRHRGHDEAARAQSRRDDLQNPKQ